MKVKIDEIAKDIYRVAVLPEGSFISFNHYLIKDKVSTLVHAGHRATFTAVRDAVSEIIPLTDLRLLLFSHFESDECGSLNDWLGLLPDLQVRTNKICNFSIQDFAIRTAQLFKDNDILELGEHSLRVLETPHFPHNWDASLFFEENTKTLFCSDVATQTGFPQEHSANPDLDSIMKLQDSLGYISYGRQTAIGIKRLRELEFEQLAVMHGAVLDKAQGEEILGQLLARNTSAMAQYDEELLLTAERS